MTRNSPSKSNEPSTHAHHVHITRYPGYQRAAARKASGTQGKVNAPELPSASIFLFEHSILFLHAIITNYRLQLLSFFCEYDSAIFNLFFDLRSLCCEQGGSCSWCVGGVTLHWRWQIQEMWSKLCTGCYEMHTH